MTILLMTILLFLWTHSLSLPKEEHLHEVIFLTDKLFYITQSKQYFGFIDVHQGNYITVEKIKQDESIIALNHSTNQMVLRKGRHNALVFQLDKLQIKQLKVEITFNTQKIVDWLQTPSKRYIVTDKDLRKYQLSYPLKQSSKNIITSCRKGEWLLKLFLSHSQNTAYRLILLRQRQLCLRYIYSNHTSQQKCLFNISSDIIAIRQINNGIFIHNKEYAYTIPEGKPVYSFRKKIRQISTLFTTLEDTFQTFMFKSRILVQGLGVYGSTEDDIFFIKRYSDDKLDIYRNQNVVGKIEKTQSPIRAWIHPLSETKHQLLLQYKQNNLQLWVLQSNSAKLQWSHRSQAEAPQQL